MSRAPSMPGRKRREELAAGHASIGVGWSVCANGETYEFFLTLDGQRMTPDVGMFRTVKKTPEAHVVSALQELMARRDTPLHSRG